MVKLPEFKSAKCSDGACVEVRVTRHKIYLRSSEVPHHVLGFTPQEWDAFIAGAKLGEFDVDQA